VPLLLAPDEQNVCAKRKDFSFFSFFFLFLFFRFLVEDDDVPLDKDDLVASAALLFLELKIVHGPAALVFRQVCKKLLVRARRLLLFDWHDFRLLLIETEDDVLVLLLEFQVLIHCQTF
jgi:hypothetical protein